MFCVRGYLWPAAEDFCFVFRYWTIFLEKTEDLDSELLLSSSASTNVVEKCLFRFCIAYLAVKSSIKRLFLCLMLSLIT